MNEFNLTDEQIAQNYERFRILINESFPSRKDQLNQMYDEMEDEVLVAPASSYEFFHNAFPGGYVNHVLRVYDFALLQFRLWKHCGMRIDFVEEELKFSALHHDLGKLGLPWGNYYQPETEDWWKKNRGRMYKGNDDVPNMKTNDVTLYLLNHYGVKYSVAEMIAIKLTDGLFEEGNDYYLKGFDLNKKLRNSLPYLLHHADIMAYRFEFERWATASGKFKFHGE